MRSFGKSFASTIKVISIADEAIDSDVDNFGAVWEAYQRTLDDSILSFKDEPFKFELKVVRSPDEQKQIDEARRSVAGIEKSKDPAKINEACRKVLEACLVGVENCSDFPDLTHPDGKRQALDLIMAHGHGLSLFLTLQQYENRGLLAATNLKKS